MSFGPDKVAIPQDFYNGTGTSITSTGATPVITLPAGRKVICVAMPGTSTMTVKVQNSIDGNTWFDVSSSTVSTVGVAQGAYMAEVDSAVPKWRVNITSFAALGVGTNVAQIAQVPGAAPQN